VSHGYLWHEFGDVHLMLPLCGQPGTGLRGQTEDAHHAFTTSLSYLSGHKI
jgi:hypothetical protein